MHGRMVDLKIQSNLQRIKATRKNQGPNLLGSSFRNRNDITAPILLYGQFCNVAFWEGESFGVQLWKSIILQKRGIRFNLERFEWGEGIIIFNYGCHKWMALIIAGIKYFFVVNFFDIYLYRFCLYHWIWLRKCWFEWST